MSTEKPPFPSRTADQFVVRFPDGMRDRIRLAAEANGRSMNAEIVARLQASFDEAGGGERVRQLEEMLKTSRSAIVAKDGLIHSLNAAIEFAIDGMPESIERRMLERFVNFSCMAMEPSDAGDISGVVDAFFASGFGEKNQVPSK